MERVLPLPTKSSSAIEANYDLSTFDTSIHLFDPISLYERVHRYSLVQKIDALYVLVDTGEGAGDMYRGIPAEVYLREIFRRFNRSLPHVPLAGGVWKLSSAPQSNVAGGYVATGIEYKLDSGRTLPSIGTIDLSTAIDSISDFASATKGNVALLLLGDWKQIDDDVFEAVSRFRQRGFAKTGFQVLPQIENWNSVSSVHCVYSIGLSSRYSTSRLDGADLCGFSVAADKVAQPNSMAHFVERVLFGPPADTDGDGVYDYADLCPEEGRERLVDFNGCLRFGEGVQDDRL